MQSKKMKSDIQKSIEKLETIKFWDFLNYEGDLLENYQKHKIEFDQITPFPKDLIEQEKFNLFTNKLGERIRMYENNPCFGFLEKFYEYYKNASKSSNKDLYTKEFYYSTISLQLFTLCDEKRGYINNNSNI